MTYNHVHTAELDVGQMIQRSFGVVLKNPVTFLVLGLVFQGAPTALLQFVQSQGVGVGAIDAGRRLIPGVENWQLLIAAYAVLLFTSGLYSIAIVRAVVDGEAGRKASLVECLRTLAHSALPGLILGFLFVLGYMATAIFLIVPGIIFMCAFYVALPVLVVERKGVLNSFSRSAKLTKGRRWAIFGTTFVIGIMVGIINLVITLIGGVIAQAVAIPAAQSILQGLIAGTTGTVSSALSTVVYLRLVHLREGGEATKLADVFA